MASEGNKKVRSYFGCTVVVYRENDWSPLPWRFEVVEPNGIIHKYYGIPNKCSTARSALKRAWYRAKWLADGTYSDKYHNM